MKKITMILLFSVFCAAMVAQTLPPSQAELNRALVEATDPDKSYREDNPTEVIRLLEAGAQIDSLERYDKMRVVVSLARNGDSALFFKYHNDKSKNRRDGLFYYDEAIIIGAAVKGGNHEILEAVLKKYGMPSNYWAERYPILVEVAEKGNIEMARILIRYGAKVNGGSDKHPYLMPTLSTAAEKGDTLMMRLFIEHGAIITERGRSTQDQPFYHAIMGGHVEAVDMLIAFGAKFVQGQYGYNPIPDASARGYTDIVKRLVEAGYDINGWHGDETGLHAALVNGHYQTVKYLLDNGAVFYEDRTDKSWGYSLAKAAELGYRDIAELILDRNENDARKDKYIVGAIESASNTNHLDIVQWLLTKSEQKPDVQFFLQQAVVSGATASVDFWLEQGGRADTLYRERYRDYFWGTPRSLVETAALRGHTDVVKTLVDHGVSHDILGIAARYGDPEMIRFLVSRGIKPAPADLYAAAAAQKPDNVRLLLSYGLNPDGYRDRMKRTPLLSAVEFEYSEMNEDRTFTHVDSLIYQVAQALIDKGADVNACDYEGMTPLMFAVAGGYTRTVRLLLEKGARREATNDFGDHARDFFIPWDSGSGVDSVLMDLMGIRYTPEELENWDFWGENQLNKVKRKSQYQKDSELYEAVVRKDIVAVRAVIKAGGNTVIYDDEQEPWSVLGSALNAGTPVAIYRLLVENGAPVDASNSNGTTSLMRAAMAGDTDAAAFFISRGADVNRENAYGNTALIFAAKNGDLAMIRLLVSHGADVNHPGNGGTPLDFAKDGQHREAVELLRSLVSIMLPAFYPRSELHDLQQRMLSNEWCDFYFDKSDGNYYLKRANICVNLGDYNECWQDSVVTVYSERDSEVFIHGFKPSERPVKTVTDLSGKPIYAQGEDMSFEFGGKTYLFSTDLEIPEDEEPSPYTGDIYYCFSDENSSWKQLVFHSRVAEGILPTIIWVGDMDRDFKPDFLLDISDDYEQTKVALFLSSAAEDGELVKLVGDAVYNFDC